MLNLFEYIAYTEQKENHITMILDGVFYSVLHFCRVILSRMVEPSCSQSFLDEYCIFFDVCLLNTTVCGHLCTSAVSSPDITLLMIRSLHHLS